MTPNFFRTKLRRIVDSIAATLETFVASRLMDAEDIEKLAVTIAAGAAAADMIAEQFVADAVGQLPKPRKTEPDVERIAELIATIASEDRSPLHRLQRLSAGEIEGAGRFGVTASMQARGITSYRWELDPDPCPRCIRLGERTWPVTVPPISHPNCQCVPVPNLEGDSE